MGIFSRVTDIINANLTAMLDKAEDPQKMIRLIIQEMEETLIEVRTSSARVIADKKELQRRIDYLVQQARDWEEKAKLAINKDREDLARAALLEKSRVEESVENAQRELLELEEHLQALNAEIAQLQQKLDDAKAKRNALVMRQKTAQSRLRVKRQLSRDKLEDAFTKYEQYERKLDELEGQVESYDVGTQGADKAKDLAAEIDELAKNEQVDQELERLKAELNKKQSQ